MVEHESPKRRGRPRLPDDERKRHTMTFRMRDELRASYIARAEKNGSSVSEEVEKSLEKEAALAETITNQKDIICNLQDVIATKEKQILEYKDILSEYKIVTKAMQSSSFYMIKQAHDFASQLLDDMAAGRDLATRIGNRGDIEKLLIIMKTLLAQNSE
ncbi:hypothetical protein MKK88_02605 [Methylobacterium sp. E-005]|uniref:hypothetical protein n=1 Tax=Methylobacterium sp. E-005 TaxID=2836549 RepID=UPI001FBA9E89|nr:hypothetical protein [Methylobacterium sp. E-005]MCJ2084885.1 hypothetical protein [Methylobacterium sp. E-005]